MRFSPFSLLPLFFALLLLIPLISSCECVDAGTPSFTVYREGIFSIAKNSTNAIVCNETDAITVMQNVTDSLPDTGGTIYLFRGQFLVYHIWNITNPYVVVVGDGRATELKLNASLPCIINITSNAVNVQIRNLLLWCDDPSDTYAIYFNNKAGIIWYPLIIDVMTINLNAIGTDDNAYGIAQVLQFPRFERLTIENPYEYGLKLTSTIDGRVSDVIIFSNEQKQNTYGLFLNATIPSGYIIERITVIRQGYGLCIVNSNDTKVSDSFFDLMNNTYALNIHDSCRVIVENTYLHNPHGTGLLISGTSNLTMVQSVTACSCKIGIADTSNPNGIQYFIGVLPDGSTTMWNIQSNDIVIGSLTDSVSDESEEIWYNNPIKAITVGCLGFVCLLVIAIFYERCR